MVKAIRQGRDANASANDGKKIVHDDGGRRKDTEPQFGVGIEQQKECREDIDDSTTAEFHGTRTLLYGRKKNDALSEQRGMQSELNLREGATDNNETLQVVHSSKNDCASNDMKTPMENLHAGILTMVSTNAIELEMEADTDTANNGHDVGIIDDESIGNVSSHSLLAVINATEMKPIPTKNTREDIGNYHVETITPIKMPEQGEPNKRCGLGSSIRRAMARKGMLAMAQTHRTDKGPIRTQNTRLEIITTDDEVDSSKSNSSKTEEQFKSPGTNGSVKKNGNNHMENMTIDKMREESSSKRCGLGFSNRRHRPNEHRSKQSAGTTHQNKINSRISNSNTKVNANTLSPRRREIQRNTGPMITGSSTNECKQKKRRPKKSKIKKTTTIRQAIKNNTSLLDSNANTNTNANYESKYVSSLQRAFSKMKKTTPNRQVIKNNSSLQLDSNANNESKYVSSLQRALAATNKTTRP